MGLMLKWGANRNRAREAAPPRGPEPAPPAEPVFVEIEADMPGGRPAYELTDSERYRVQAQAMSEAAQQAQGRREADSYLKLARAWRRLANEAAELETRSLRA